MKIFKRAVSIILALALLYAGGDAMTGAATVILAMGAGKRSAKSILESFLK